MIFIMGSYLKRIVRIHPFSVLKNKIQSTQEHVLQSRAEETILSGSNTMALYGTLWHWVMGSGRQTMAVGDRHRKGVSRKCGHYLTSVGSARGNVSQEPARNSPSN